VHAWRGGRFVEADVEMDVKWWWWWWWRWWWYGYFFLATALWVHACDLMCLPCRDLLLFIRLGFSVSVSLLHSLIEVVGWYPGFNLLTHVFQWIPHSRRAWRFDKFHIWVHLNDASCLRWHNVGLLTKTMGETRLATFFSNFVIACLHYKQKGWTSWRTIKRPSLSAVTCILIPGFSKKILRFVMAMKSSTFSVIGGI